MGTSISKYGEELSEKQQEEVTEASVPSTPILTPKLTRKLASDEELIDPRSPSVNICRTPIHMILEEKLDKLEVRQTKQKYVPFGIDPRSATDDFTRTPIIVTASRDNNLLKKLHNKNLDNALKYSNTDTPVKIIPPKLLGSSPIAYKPDAYKRKSFVGILETNIDFTETNLDEVIKEKTKIKKNSRTPKKDTIDVVKSENQDPRSPTTDFIRTPIQIIKKIGEIDINKNIEEIKHNEKFVETVNIPEIIADRAEKDFLVCLNQDAKFNIVDEKIQSNRFVHNMEYLHNEETIEEVTENYEFEETLEEKKVEEKIKQETIENIKADNRQEILKENTIENSKTEDVTTDSSDISKIEVNVVGASTSKLTPSKKQNLQSDKVIPLVNITADVKDFNKKLTNLIYEDNDLVVLPRIVKLRGNNRTPLGVRNTTGVVKKSNTKLKVSDKPRKSEAKKTDYTVSKIPVFKEKSKGKKMNIQCENTPPRNMERKIPRKMQWDGDNTLVI